jgi:hypothetical protein
MFGGRTLLTYIRDKLLFEQFKVLSVVGKLRRQIILLFEQSRCSRSSGSMGSISKFIFLSINSLDTSPIIFHSSII